jgi:AcrR family transcriptional regulator
MSRSRSRPTREETSERVFAAALAVFQRVGITGASIEEIVKEAGLTRGAFYSSWANKDDLVVAILQRQVAEAIQRNKTLAERYPDPVEFLQALFTDDGSPQPMLDAFPLLNLELTLYVARSPEHRPALSALLQAVRKTTGQLVVTTARNAGITRHLDPDEIGAMLLALEDGFDLHRLIDPEQTPKDAYFLALGQLQSLLLDSRRAQ